MPTLKIQLSDYLYKKLLKKKEEDGYGGKSWVDWIRHITKGVIVNPTPSDLISKGTREHLAELWAENFIMNLPEIIDWDRYPECKEEKSIGLLPKFKDRSALVVGAGPSIWKHNHLQVIAESDYGGVLFITDRMLIPCLKAEITPEKFPDYFVVSVDGNREKILKFFDDPIVDKYADGITALFAATGAPTAVKRFKGRKYFFLGMLDPFHEMDSVTGFMNYMVKLTAVSCLGNTGSAAIVIAHYLGCKPIILCGMTLGYLPETPLEETAYYQTLKKSGLSEEQILQFFYRGYNPLFDREYVMDAVFKHYRDSLVDAIEQHGIEVVNATEEGSIHGAGIKGMTLKEALRRYKK